MNWRSNPQPSMNRRRQDLWRRLIDGALASISERGYSETSVSHITDHARVGRTQFYFVFQNKSDCFLALQSAVFEELCSRIEEVVDHDQLWDVQVKAATEEALNTFDKEPIVAKIALIESPLAGPEAQEQHRLAMSRILTSVKCDDPRPAECRGLPISLGEMAIGSATAVLNKEFHSVDGPDFARLGPEIFFAVAVPFVGPEAAATRTREIYSDLPWPPGQSSMTG